MKSRKSMSAIYHSKSRAIEADLTEKYNAIGCSDWHTIFHQRRKEVEALRNKSQTQLDGKLSQQFSIDEEELDALMKEEGKQETEVQQSPSLKHK